MTEDRFEDGRGVIVVADDPAVRAAAEAAVQQAAMRLVATVTWNQARERLSAQAAPAILLIEAIGIAEDTIAHVLPDLVDTAGAASCIVTFAHDRVDPVGPLLIGSGAALLCEPTAAERIAALVIAMRDEPIDMRDNREEAARQARIDAEIARFTETLARLTGAPQGARGAAERDPIVGDRRPDFGHPPAGAVIVTPADLRRAIRARRLRDEVFGLPGLFEDPAWDMLLDLYAAELERRDVSVSSLCIAAAVAPTTALRWINKLIAIGLLERRPDSFDRRRAFVALTERCSTALHDYMAALHRAGLSIA